MSLSKSTTLTSSESQGWPKSPADVECPASDIMVYFAGSPDGHSSAHDHEAEKIARRAREVALARWRWQDMQSYMLLMILEVSLHSRLELFRT